MTGYVVTRWYRAPEVILSWMHYTQTGQYTHTHTHTYTHTYTHLHAHTNTRTYTHTHTYIDVP